MNRTPRTPADAMIDCPRCGGRHAAFIQGCTVSTRTNIDENAWAEPLNILAIGSEFRGDHTAEVGFALEGRSGESIEALIARARCVYSSRGSQLEVIEIRICLPPTSVRPLGADGPA